MTVGATALDALVARTEPGDIVQVHLKPGEGAVLDEYAAAHGLLFAGKPSRGKALRAMMAAALA